MVSRGSEMRMLYSAVIIVFVILSYRLSGCGKSDDASPDGSTRDSGTTNIETPRSAADTRAADTVSNPFQQAAPIKKNESSTPPTVDDAATSDMGNSPTATPQEPTVTGVETVTGPHGPFPTESTAANTSTEQPPVETTPPAGEPNTPRGPFGPFSTQP